MRAVRGIVRYLAMPVLLGGAGWLTFALLAAGHAQALVLTVMSLVLFVLVWGLEVAVPFRPTWNTPDGQRFHDIGHSLVGTALGGMLGNVVTFAVAGVAAGALADARDGGLWPKHWPIGVEVALVFLLADLGRYVQHRAMHAVPLLWRFHELHHSTGVMTVFKTSRNHIVERFFQQLFLLGPVIALGAGAEAILPFVVVNSYLGVFDHSNVDFRLGYLEHVIMGPAAHRIHHSRDVGEGNSNFGTALVVWDRVFRTFTSPIERGRRGWTTFDVGIERDPTPSGFLAQLVEPFRRRPYASPLAGSSDGPGASAG